MNKLTVGFAACALILTSCNKNEVTESLQNDQKLLQFSAVSGNQTKALEAGLIDLKGVSAGLLLKAYKIVGTDQSPYFSENLKWNTTDSKWETDQQRFFPADGTLNFYSYYPTVGTYIDAGTGSTDVPTLDYTIEANATDQKDLMAAGTSLASVLTATQVTLPFKHILSQINFGVKGYNGAKIKISNIKIVGVANKSTYSFSPTNTGLWATPTGTAAYDYMTGTTNVYETNGTDGGTTPVTYIFGDGGNNGPGTASATLQYVNKANSNSLILMPQALAGTAFTFDYTITDMGNTIVAAATDASASLANAVVTKWDPSTRYVYIIDFTDFLDGRKLTFEVNVDANPWVNNNAVGNNDGDIKALLGSAPTATATSTKTLTGNLLENLLWDYTGKFASFTTGETFTLDFTNVIFGDKKVTITFDSNVDVTMGGNAQTSPFDVAAASTVVFTAK